MSQLDLFADQDAPVVDPRTAKALPNPLDGLIHMMTGVQSVNGKRHYTVKCGAPVPAVKGHERAAGVTGWNSLVTCDECRYHPPLITPTEGAHRG